MSGETAIIFQSYSIEANRSSGIMNTTWLTIFRCFRNETEEFCMRGTATENKVSRCVQEHWAAYWRFAMQLEGAIADGTSVEICINLISFWDECLIWRDTLKISRNCFLKKFILIFRFKILQIYGFLPLPSRSPSLPSEIFHQV